jgi:hypothetical protein
MYKIKELKEELELEKLERQCMIVGDGGGMGWVGKQKKKIPFFLRFVPVQWNCKYSPLSLFPFIPFQ